jgi:hypothetical protein
MMSRVPWTQIISAFVLAGMLVVLTVSFAGWIVMAALSAAVVMVVSETFRSFAYVVVMAHKPDVEALVRPRRAWSPYPVIRASVVESVGGANLHVHQRPRLFWFVAMLMTALLYAATGEPAFIALTAVEAGLMIAGLWYARWRAYRGENA